MTSLYQINLSRYNYQDGQSITWAICDKYGREIGVRVSTFEVERTLEEQPQWGGYTYEDAMDRIAKGDNFGAVVQPLRDGKKYQSGNTLYFKTAEEREAYIQRYLKDSYKRVQKKIA
jgi:hypothetical protein